MDDEEEASNTRLCLGIGTGAGDHGGSKQKPAAQLHVLLPSHSERNIGKEDDGSSSKVNDEGDDHDTDNDEHGKCNARKKLMLSKEQSGMLEDVFKERNTITQKEKQELGKKVNLQPRQVEVWFQNRRARIKSKQVEMNCEFFKKCCESLRTENLLLKNELQELKSTAREKVHEICPSCQRVVLIMDQEGKMEKEAFGAMEGSSMTS